MPARCLKDYNLKYYNLKYYNLKTYNMRGFTPNTPQPAWLKKACDLFPLARRRHYWLSPSRVRRYPPLVTCWHQPRCSRYQATVFSRPVSKDSSGAQPRSR